MSDNDDDDDWNSSGEDEYEEEDEEEIQYEPEINVFERVGLPGDMFGINPLTMAEKIAMSPLDKFKMDVRIVARQLDSWDIDISNDDIIKMIETAVKVDKVEHKNPTAYVLGFLASNGGRKLDHKLFKYVVDQVIDKTEKGNVKPADVIRYARLWERL